jgi:hypothetical protein
MKPVFILGCGHSGTSVTLAMLGNHSRLYAVPFESSLMYAKHDEEIYLTALWWRLKALVQGKGRWVEKTPNHVRKIERIFSIFPNARIILMIRDGRDVVCSLKKRKGEFDEFEKAVLRWLNDNLEGKSYWFHPSVKLIRLEELVKNPQALLKEVCDFLDEEPQVEQMLNYYKSDRIFYDPKKRRRHLKRFQHLKNLDDHSSLRDSQLKQPLLKDTSRWKKELSDSELSQFMTKAGWLMKELHYD